MDTTHDDPMTLRLAWLGALGALLVAGPALAQDDGSEEGADALEMTMTLLPEGATVPDAVTRTIELPDPATLQADPPGLDRANEVREQRELGLETAAEAREQGQQMSQQAQEGRENAGRGQDIEPPALPDQVPDGAGPPEDRGPGND